MINGNQGKERTAAVPGEDSSRLAPLLEAGGRRAEALLGEGEDCQITVSIEIGSVTVALLVTATDHHQDRGV
jgi:hypothetical protein